MPGFLYVIMSVLSQYLVSHINFFSFMCLWNMWFSSVELYSLKRNCIETTSIARGKQRVSSRLPGSAQDVALAFSR